MEPNKYTIPKSYELRVQLRKQISCFVDAQALCPPLSLADLGRLTEAFVQEHSEAAPYSGWLMVEINNYTWKTTVAAIPYDKRVLLLPKCMSNSAKCEATFDELGLLCYRCQQCTIPNLQDRAEELGMMSIVAEGFTSVIGLIENRVVDTVIGVGCLESLERAFPLLVNHAVPGVAIPLNSSGCKDTSVDYDYVNELLTMYSENKHYLLDYDYVKATIQKWFAQENIARITSHSTDITAQLTREWLAGDGKRWRPYLLAATYMALKQNTDIPEEVSLAAVAVECFHKASLVHDDIQDEDDMRYGKQTVHAAHGVPIAINVGDMLLGEGYRLLTQCGNMELVSVAAQAHIALCKGQGMELAWCRNPTDLSLDFVLDIFVNKTAPAFDVALAMGVICADADRKLVTTLHNYAEALGIAYQLQDDIADFDTNQPIALRPSAVLALLCEQNRGTAFVGELLQCNNLKDFLQQEPHKPLLDAALTKVAALAYEYHQKALAVLNEVGSIELKRLLFRVTKRILE